MKKPVRIIGVDYGKDGWTTEVEARHLPDGTIEIRDLRQWRHDIELTDRRSALEAIGEKE